MLIKNNENVSNISLDHPRCEIYAENIAIIDFWATWCKPCIRAIPKLVALYEAFSDKGVQIIGISVDSPRNVQKVKPFAKSLGITYPVLLDINSEVMTRLNVNLLPTLLLVNDQDEIVLIHQGYRQDFFRLFTKVELFQSADKSKSYADFVQKSLTIEHSDLAVTVGNYYHIIGRGLLLRSYEIPGTVFEDMALRERHGFFREMDGIIASYTPDKTN